MKKYEHYESFRGCYIFKLIPNIIDDDGYI